MKKLIIVLIALLPVLGSATETEYELTNSVPVMVEARTFVKSIVATSYKIDQLSILRLPDGGIQCRVTLIISDGVDEYRRVIAVDREELIEALGEDYLAALIDDLGEAVGAILIEEATP